MSGTRIRFYTDEHVGRAVIKGLRRRGVNVLTVPEAGLLGATDSKHLEHAREEHRVIFTQDDDFLRLAAAGHPHAGIVYTPQHASVRQIIQGLVLIHEVMTPDEMENHVEYI